MKLEEIRESEEVRLPTYGSMSHQSPASLCD